MMTSRKTVLLFSFFALRCWEAEAADLTDFRLRKTVTAQSVQQLEARLRSADRLERLRVVCETELRASVPPTSCFSVVQMERREGLVAAKKARQTFVWLEDLCRTRTRKVGSMEQIRAALSRADVPSSCRRILEGRLKEVEYMWISRDPASLFGLRNETN